jgi:hypothetical protein
VSLCHLPVGDSLQHHPPPLLCRPDPCPELLGLGFRLELGDQVRLDRLDWLALFVPLAAGGRVGAVPPPGEVSLCPTGSARRIYNLLIWRLSAVLFVVFASNVWQRGRRLLSIIWYISQYSNQHGLD